MIKLSLKSILFVLVLSFASLGSGLFSTPAHATSTNDIIDDSVFDNTNSMSTAQIQSFLNQFPNSCLKSYSAPDPQSWYNYGAMVPASQVIKDASTIWGINPQVILTTLQKEEQLVDGSQGCANWKYWSAMGYDCPGNAGNVYTSAQVTAAPNNYTGGIPADMQGSIGPTCVASPIPVGFSAQVNHGAWQLEFGRYRSEGNGNLSWDGDNDIPYYGYMTAGTRARCQLTSTPVYCNSNYATQASYSGNITLNDGTNVTVANGATASLYSYTPFIQSFGSIFTTYFGSTSALTTSTITMHTISAPPASPAVGQSVSYTVSFTNNLTNAITVDDVGIVARAGAINGGINRDFGWQGPVTLQPGVAQQFTFTTTIQDTGPIYAWPAIYSGGGYIQYNNWGTFINARLPNLSLSSPLTASSTNPVAGQSVTLSATIKNNESQGIKVSSFGIPVRYYGSYNYDIAWTSPTTIAAGATQTLSGTLTTDKAGPFTAWVSTLIAGRYVTLSPTINITTTPVTPNFILGYTQTPDLTPALGEDVSVQFTLKNNLAVPITLDAVGVVGRYNNPYTGANNDFGWVGPITFAAGEQKSFTSFVSNISSLSAYYAWPAIVYQGSYTHYNNWGFMMTPHLPNLTITAPLTLNSGSTPIIGQSTPVTVTVKNNEPHPIRYLAAGIPIRYYNFYNYDTGWQGPGTLAASGQSGDSINLSGNVDFDKHGPYTIWSSLNIDGRYTTIGSPIQLQL